MSWTVVTCFLLAWLSVPSVAWAQTFSDDFSTPADRLNRFIWTTEIGAGSFLGRTQLRDWVTEGGVGRFVVADGSARLALDTFNLTGFSLYGTHAKTRVSFQPPATTDVVLAFRMRLTSLQRGLVYGCISTDAVRLARAITMKSISSSSATTCRPERRR